MVLFPRNCVVDLIFISAAHIYTLSIYMSRIPSSFTWSSFQQRNDQPEYQKTVIWMGPQLYNTLILAWLYSALCSSFCLSFERRTYNVGPHARNGNVGAAFNSKESMKWSHFVLNYIRSPQCQQDWWYLDEPFYGSEISLSIHIHVKFHTVQLCIVVLLKWREKKKRKRKRKKEKKKKKGGGGRLKRQFSKGGGEFEKANYCAYFLSRYI